MTIFIKTILKASGERGGSNKGEEEEIKGIKMQYIDVPTLYNGCNHSWTNKNLKIKEKAK